VTLPAATGTTPTFSPINLILLLMVAAVFYPLQKRLRERVSRRRKQRWAEEDRQAQEHLRRRDTPDQRDQQNQQNEQNRRDQQEQRDGE
jgi:hypothetical protein